MLGGGFLSAKERTALQAVMRHLSEIHGVARRANAILLLDDGWNCAKVAEALYLDDDTVRTWFKRYQAGGLDEMKVFDWKGRSGDLSRERMAELSARLGERLMRDSGEVAAYIAARWGVVYGPSGCVALLHRLGFEYKRPESLPARSDEARQAAFISRYDQLLNGLAADEVVYFADAVHPEYQSRPAHGWVRKGDKVALRRTSGRQRLNLHAALNLENFHCPLVEAERIDAASTIALLAKLEASNPGKRRIYVIVDNARYHHARVVRQWLERPDCRITLVFLPAYAPHLNAIERLWAVMHREVTHNKFPASFGHFVEAIFDFFRRRLPKEWKTWRDTITDNFRIIGTHPARTTDGADCHRCAAPPRWPSAPAWPWRDRPARRTWHRRGPSMRPR